MPIKHNWDTDFSPKVHVLAGMLRLHCVDQHLVVWRLRGIEWTLSSLGHRKNLPTSEVAQWHEQSNTVTFRLSAGEGTKPLTITGRWPWTITNSCQCSSAATSRLGGGNYWEYSLEVIIEMMILQLYLSMKASRQSTLGYTHGSRLLADRCASYELDADVRHKQGFYTGLTAVRV